MPLDLKKLELTEWEVAKTSVFKQVDPGYIEEHVDPRAIAKAQLIKALEGVREQLLDSEAFTSLYNARPANYDYIQGYSEAVATMVYHITDALESAGIPWPVVVNAARPYEEFDELWVNKLSKGINDAKTD